MKILPLVTGIQKDISSSGARLRTATSDGYKIAKRTSRIYNQGSIRRFINITRSVTNKVASNTTRQEIPYVAGAIGLFIPIPFLSPLLFGIGMLARIPSNRHSLPHINNSADTTTVRK